MSRSARCAVVLIFGLCVSAVAGWVVDGVPEATTDFGSHGEGTFTIDPVGGLSGFYIGETALSTTLAGYQPLGADRTNALLTAATTNTLAGTAWQTLTVTNAVTLLWTNTQADTYTLVLDCGTNSVTWPTNWTWLLGTPDGTNIVASWFPKPGSGWYAIGGGQ